MGKTLLKLFSDRLFAVAGAPPSSSSLPAISSFSCQRSTLLPWRCRFSSSNTASQDLSITEGCAKRIQEIVKEEGSSADKKMLRLSVEGGGCSGFQYVFSLDDKLSSSDRVFKKDGVMVVVDEISMDFVKGATIDYVEELIRSSFMVTQNPNASGGCGCGSSFNVK